MESAVKMTAQGVRDLNSRGPKKKAAAAADEAIQPESTEKLEQPSGEAAVVATTPAVEG
jgi:hypothetical protein